MSDPAATWPGAVLDRRGFWLLGRVEHDLAGPLADHADRGRPVLALLHGELRERLGRRRLEIARPQFGGALALPAAAAAQSTPPTGQKFTMSGNLLRGHQGIQRNLLEAAEKMPEADYQFKPTPEMRPYGQLVAHVALSQFGGCAAL